MENSSSRALSSIRLSNVFLVKNNSWIKLPENWQNWRTEYFLQAVRETANTRQFILFTCFIPKMLIAGWHYKEAIQWFQEAFLDWMRQYPIEIVRCDSVILRRRCSHTLAYFCVNYYPSSFNNIETSSLISLRNSMSKCEPMLTSVLMVSDVDLRFRKDAPLVAFA